MARTPRPFRIIQLNTWTQHSWAVVDGDGKIITLADDRLAIRMTKEEAGALAARETATETRRVELAAAREKVLAPTKETGLPGDRSPAAG